MTSSHELDITRSIKPLARMNRPRLTLHISGMTKPRESSHHGGVFFAEPFVRPTMMVG